MPNVKVNYHTKGPMLKSNSFTKDGTGVKEPAKGQDIKVNRGFKSNGVPKRK